MLKFSPAFIALVFFMAAGIAPATQAFQGRSDEIIYNTTAGEMAVLLKSFGWEVELVDDGEGVPDAIQINFNNYKSWLRLKNCLENVPERCGTLIFFANFNLGRKVSSQDMVILNSYNDKNVIGRAYYLEKPDQDNNDQIGIDFRISLNGGVTREHLTLEAKKWDEVIDTFVETHKNQQ